MAVVEGGTSGALVGVGAESQSAMHVTARPDPAGTLGHYRTSHRASIIAVQKANSRLFELQNAHATNIIILHAIRMEWIQTANHTAAILDSIDIFRCTSFSAVDTTQTVTPVISKLRTSFATAGANVRGITVAGHVDGMTGGSLVKDANPLRQLGQWLLAAVPTGSVVVPMVDVFSPDVASGESPLILAQNEGIIVENRVLLGAAGGSAFSIDVEWSEVTAY